MTDFTPLSPHRTRPTKRYAHRALSIRHDASDRLGSKYGLQISNEAIVCLSRNAALLTFQYDHVRWDQKSKRWCWYELAVKLRIVRKITVGTRSGRGNEALAFGLVTSFTTTLIFRTMLRGQGLSCDEISKMLGISTRTVTRYLKTFRNPVSPLEMTIEQLRTDRGPRLRASAIEGVRITVV